MDGAQVTSMEPVTLVVLDSAVRIATILLLPRNRRPSALAIFFIPSSVCWLSW